jgi:hypothetical protein
MWYVPRPRRNFSGLSYLGETPEDTHIAALTNQVENTIREVAAAERTAKGVQLGIDKTKSDIAMYGLKTFLTREESAIKKDLETALRASERQLLDIKGIQIEGGKAVLAELQQKIKDAQARRAQKSAVQEQAKAQVAAVTAEVESDQAKYAREMRERERLRDAAERTQRQYGGQKVAAEAPQGSTYEAFVSTARDLGAEIDQLKKAGNKAAAQARISIVMNKMYAANQAASQEKTAQSGTEAATQAMDNALNFSGSTSGGSAKEILINFARTQITDLRENPGVAVKRFNDRAGGLRAALMEAVATGE